MVTRGLSCVSQEEMAVILECQPDETTVPVDVFTHFSNIYNDASKGNGGAPRSKSFSSNNPLVGCGSQACWAAVTICTFSFSVSISAICQGASVRVSHVACVHA